MKHKLKNVATKPFVLCPNCRQSTTSQVDYTGSIFVCLNPTCGWIFGSDYELRGYFASLQTAKEVFRCKHCKEVIEKDTGFPEMWRHRKNWSVVCPLTATPQDEPEPIVCKNCGNTITKSRIGVWLHEGGSSGCPKNTIAQPKEDKNGN